MKRWRLLRKKVSTSASSKERTGQSPNDVLTCSSHRRGRKNHRATRHGPALVFVHGGATATDLCCRTRPARSLSHALQRNKEQVKQPLRRSKYYCDRDARQHRMLASISTQCSSGTSQAKPSRQRGQHFVCLKSARTLSCHCLTSSLNVTPG